MKNIKDLDKKTFSKIKLLVFDVDGVIVPFGTKIYETEDYIKMKIKHPSKEFYELAKKLSRKYKILISSGRSMLTLRTMFSDLVSERLYLQAEAGVRTFSVSESFTTFKFGSKYYKKLNSILDGIRELRNKNIVAVEPKESILTIHCKKELKEIYNIVKKFDKEKELYVIWGGEAFDIGHKKATKGTGLNAFCKKFGIKKQEVLCVGDTEAESFMFNGCGVSVTSNKKLKADYYLPGKLPGIDLMRILSREL